METYTNFDPTFNRLNIMEKLETVRETFYGSGIECSIYRVPWYMKHGKNENSYTPQAVSFGPYHYGNQQLAPMEFHKYRALHCRLNRYQQDTAIYFRSVCEIEDHARACYEGNLDQFPHETFLEMLVVDSCFILEVLQGFDVGFEQLGYPVNDPVFSDNEYMKFGIVRDMILLENQIPFFVLAKLFACTNPSDDLVTLVLNMGDCSMISPGLTFGVDRPFNTLDHSSCRHCLDIFRSTLAQDHQEQVTAFAMPITNRNADPISIPSATQLNDLGIKFRASPMRSLVDMRFTKGVLEIPRITLSESSEPMFLNLMAFERRFHHLRKPIITPYILFLDKLLKSPSDVGLLVKHGILVHNLGRNEEVANVFNRVGRGIHLSMEYNFAEQFCKQLNAYYEMRKRRVNWRQIAFIAVIVTTVEILLSILQTYCGFAQLKQQHA